MPFISVLDSRGALVNKGRTPYAPSKHAVHVPWKSVSKNMLSTPKMENGVKIPDGIIGRGRGRGITTGTDFLPNVCLCQRPCRRVLCNVCGYLTKGRIRYSCPIHPQTVFLIDITQCPRCRAYSFMMTEF